MDLISALKKTIKNPLADSRAVQSGPIHLKHRRKK